MVTFSSIEHSGLGRYGDSLNPWGDLITMAQSWCLLKPGEIKSYEIKRSIAVAKKIHPLITQDLETVTKKMIQLL